MNSHKYFITGIGTDIGKTIVSAILVEHFNAGYWKPIQAGSIEKTDTDIIKEMTNCKNIYKEKFILSKAMSPHAAAKFDKINISLNEFKLPRIKRNLIIEGAGGLMVPINNKNLILDLIKHFHCEVIIISKNYLGSINHTLLTVNVLKNNNVPIKGIIFNGESNIETEKIIKTYTGIPILAKIRQFDILTKNIIIKESKKINII